MVQQFLAPLQDLIEINWSLPLALWLFMHRLSECRSLFDDILLLRSKVYLLPFLLRQVRTLSLEIMIPIFLSLRVVLIADLSYHQTFLVKLMFGNGLSALLRWIDFDIFGAMQ